MSNDDFYKVENFYNKIKNCKDRNCDYENYKKLLLKLNSHYLFVGKTGSGKTNLALDLIKKIGAFTRIYLFAKNLEEPLWKTYIANIRKLEIKINKKLLYHSPTLDSLVEPEKFLDKNETNLMIFDDFIGDISKKKYANIIYQNILRCRKENCTTFFLSQNYFTLPLEIRGQFQYIILKKVGSLKEFKRIITEYAFNDIPKSTLLNLYHLAGQSMDDFLLIDVDGRIFRQGYNKILEIS